MKVAYSRGRRDRKTAKPTARRKPVRLKRIMSAESAAKRDKRKRKGRKGVIRTLLFVLMAVAIVWSSVEGGLVERIKPRLSEKKAAKQESGSWTRFIWKGFGQHKTAQPMPKKVDWSAFQPVALFSGDEQMMGLTATSIVMPLSAKKGADLPVITGLSSRKAVPGDTLIETLPALNLLALAAEVSPALLIRLSEIALVPGQKLVLRFTDRPLSVLLSPHNLAVQLPNLERLLVRTSLPDKGVLDMRFTDIAYLKQEE